ncbi:V4R domain-containing protein [Methanolobus tindarius DSM 2278]|jgi:predicted hydrocarbon binding protein|uniref:V4R domain-containing protein n=1 Tax=Methanolobus tindarius DSM 2278 TaxID=1090322 RepID=W9DZG0_METTI|nr:V4R domain-containing protein [Methanolobus tindarius]ETA69057.1 V4R domain-containing protein [Methanolobus tindarius DSM 2278]
MVRDLYMFSRVNEKADVVWFKIAYENTLHSEADITSFFAEKELDIRFAYLDSSEDPTKGKYVMFTEAEKGRDIDSIAQELENMDVVLSVKWGYSKNRAIQSVDFPLQLLSKRAVIIRAKTFVDIINIMNEQVPQSEGLLTMIGIRNGSGAARYMQEMTEMNDDNFLDLLGELFMAAGWGKIDHEINISELTGTVRMTDSFLADEFGDSDVPSCIYISSFLAGYISECLKKTVQVRESRCKSMGDEICEHVISPAPAGVKIEHVLRGESH